MAWLVRYWNEINSRNLRSSENGAREDAMRKAAPCCAPLRSFSIQAECSAGVNRNLPLPALPLPAPSVCE